MKVDRVKNAKRGIVYGLVNKMVTLVLPFLVQTIMIKALGAEYAGIKGVLTSILSVLSLTELGIGSAIVYNMYKPISEDDIKTIGALLRLYKIIYRVIITVHKPMILHFLRNVSELKETHSFS